MRAADLLECVLQPHTTLAIDLLQMVRARNTDDPTYRFQIAGLLVFLAGVDKALSLAIELLYLAGKVEWDWLKGRRPHPAALVSSAPGMTAKLIKLQELGLDLRQLQWLVDLRNSYVHSCSIYGGYKFGFEGERFAVRPHGLELSFTGEPLAVLGADALQAYDTQLKEQLGGFLDRNGWHQAWASIDERLAKLPINPEPEYSRMARPDAGADEIERGIDALNVRYIGEGLRELLKPSS